MYLSIPIAILVLVAFAIAVWLAIRWAERSTIASLLQPLNIAGQFAADGIKPPSYCHGRAYHFKELKFVIMRCKGTCPDPAKCQPPIIFVARLKKGESATCKCGDKDVTDCSLVVTKTKDDEIKYSCNREKCDDNKPCKIQKQELDDEIDLYFCACENT